MITKSNLPGWRFYVLWLTSNSIIMILAEFAGLFLIGGIAAAVVWDSLEILQFVAKFTFLASLFLGVGQWLTLSRYLPKIGSWVLATIAGWCISLPTLFYVFVHEIGGEYTTARLVVTAIIFLGSGVGICQWLAIRRWRYSGWWIVIVICDVALSLLIGQLVNMNVPSIGFGLLTGWGVIWLSGEQPGSLSSAER